MKKNNMKYTVITGASSGIGYEIAKIFASQNKNLIIVARREEKLETLKNEILTNYPQIEIIIKRKDLSILHNMYVLYDELKDYFIETWINNAGIGDYQKVGFQDLNKINSMINLNLTAVTILSSLYVKDYSKVDGAQLINVSSAGGYTIVPNAVIYCATKFYVSAFTEGLAWEMKETNSALKVKLLAPAATETEFGKLANNTTKYNYDEVFVQYNTSQEVAKFLLDLYDSEKVVGIVNRNNFQFEMYDSFFTYAGNSKYNQKMVIL